jgi:hypothetical protein
MATQYDHIDDKRRAFIEWQHVFFVASAAEGARINVSPKGLDALRVLGPNAVVYLDLTGSGNETSAHLMADGRMTIMFCAFDGPPVILRLYGRGRVLPRGGTEYAALLAERYGGVEPLGARQMVLQDINLVQTSCGYGVPNYAYAGERPSLPNWSMQKGADGLVAYRQEKNTRSIDGLPTGFVEPA